MSTIKEPTFKKFISKCIDNENLELECVFDSDNTDKNIFLRIVNSFKSISKFNSEEFYLDVSIQDYKKVSDIRMTITGKSNIMDYCKSDSIVAIDNVSFLKKNIYKENSPEFGSNDYTFRVFDKELDHRLNIKSEVEVAKESGDVEAFLNNYSDKFKNFRYKKRYSFISFDKLFRFDITAVKNNKRKSKTFKGADILSNKETYEVEIEYIGSQMNEDGVKYLEQYYKDLLSGVNFNTMNPYGLISPIDFGLLNAPPIDPKDIKQAFNPEISILKPEGLEDVFQKDIVVKEKTLQEQIDEAEENILMFKGLLADLEEDEEETAEGFKETIKEFEEEKLRLEGLKSIPKPTIKLKIKKPKKTKKTKKGKKGKTEQGGGANIPEWAKAESVDEDYDEEEYFKEEEVPEYFYGDQEEPDILDYKSYYEYLTDQIYILFNKHIHYLLTLIHDTSNILTNTEKMNVLGAYKKITNQKCLFQDIRLVIPQPVTLTKDDINPYNPDTILFKYAVTEKADGERYILFISNKKGYLINSKKNIIDTGIDFSNLTSDYIFDGEYITKDKDNEDIKLYKIFDVYYAGNLKDKYVHKLHFHATVNHKPCRYNIMKTFKTDILDNITDNTIEVDIKKYDFGRFKSNHSPDDDKYLTDCAYMLKNCNKIMNQNSYKYHIDGLIFIPLFHSVKAKNMYEKPDYIGGTWNLNFKWKPPEENTIDFQVRYVKEKIGTRVKDKEIPFTVKDNTGSETIHKYKQLQLMVGFDQKHDKSVDICMKILGVEPEQKGNIIPFSPDDDKILHTTNVLVDDEKKKVLCEKDKIEINDGDIVEMRYNPNATNQMIWEPLRVRSDKTKPQFFTIANNVWSTITNPVSVELVTNKMNKSKLKKEFKANKYYVSKQDNAITEPLRKLHNYIKTNLIVGVGSSFKSKINILDMSIGRGGDINRYLDVNTNAKFILGLDLSSNVEEACERYHNKSNGKTLGVFLIADTSQDFSIADCYDELEGEDIGDMVNHSKTMLNILYNLKQPVPKEYKQIQKKYNNKALEKFHIISSQFTFHYYFKDDTTFDGVMQNIKNNIAKGGYFIGCCYDGLKVFETLKDGDLEFKDSEGKLIYSIEKQYEIDDFTFDPEKPDDNIDNMLGQKIDVFMESIGQKISEYLVNFQYLRYYMENNGFKLLSPNVNSKYKNLLKENNITDGFGDFEKVIKNLKGLSDQDKDLQEKGYYHKSLDILKDTTYNKDKSVKEQGYEKLRQLSSLNKYFIFQKE